MKNSIFKIISALVLLISFTACVKEIHYSNGGPTITGNKEVTTEVRDISTGFDKIVKSGFTDLVLSSTGQDGKIKINGESNLLEYIETKVEDSTLYIGIKKNTSLRAHQAIKLELNAGEISSLTTAGSGDIKSDGILQSKRFDISQAGSSDLNLKLETNEIHIKMAGSGDIRLAGTSDQMKVSKTGSGDLYAYDFLVEEAEINSTGSGDAKIKVEKNLQVSKTGSGDVYYKGNPKIKAKSTGSGDIKDAN